MSPPRRDSFTQLRDTLRWRVALVLGVLITVLMVALGLLNTQLGYADTARLSWAILGVASALVAAMVLLPRRLGGTLFFAAIAVLLVGVMAWGLYHDKAMHHWGYLFPAVITFLVRPGAALAAMLLFGGYVVATIEPLVPGIDVIRFAAGYGLLVCFMYTYALLEARAAAMLRYHSDHDALSNCLNRRTFNEALAELTQHAMERTAVRHARRRDGSAVHQGAPYAVLLIDIDHFKAINDQHGHLVGDRVITAVAATLGAQLGAGVPLFRYGGEEFAVLLGDADAAAGGALAERLRTAVAAADMQGIAVTVSIGVGEWRPGRGTATAALDAADRALYDAKRGGRNRVVVNARAP